MITPQNSLTKNIRETYNDFEPFFKQFDSIVKDKITWIYTSEFDFEKNHEQYMCNYFISNKGDLLYITRHVRDILKPLEINNFAVEEICFKRRIDYDIVSLDTEDIKLYPFPYSSQFIIQYLDVLLTKKFSEKHTR